MKLMWRAPKGKLWLLRLIIKDDDVFCLRVSHSYTCMYICVYLAAGHAFCEAAKIQLKLQSRHEAATHYVDAGNCYKKADANGKLTQMCWVLKCTGFWKAIYYFTNVRKWYWMQTSGCFDWIVNYYFDVFGYFCQLIIVVWSIIDRGCELFAEG